MAYLKKELKSLESLSEIKQYVAALHVAGTGRVQQFIRVHERIKTLEIILMT